MKVFISWSGKKSKKIALIFRDWLPTVIQSIKPFVSSEDIEKGARWNTDIAQELKESSFGLICVTKENLESPWLNFEAGALSKTIDNTFVAPFLFDVKPSDLTGSPISQFQSTNFSREDMKRLVETLNAASENTLDTPRLDKAFELCYPDLEKSINELIKAKTDEEEKTEVSDYQANNIVLEEVLDTVRNTQRLLGNKDAKLYENIEQVQKKADNILLRMEKQLDVDIKRKTQKLTPWIFNQLLFSNYDDNFNTFFPYNILIILAVYKDYFPWLYDAGTELVRVINSNTEKSEQIAELNKFTDLLHYTFSNPVFREISYPIRDSALLLKDLPVVIRKAINNQKSKE